MIEVKIKDIVNGPLFHQAYDLYVQAFRLLRKLAVQNHEMSFNEFSDVMHSMSIEKHLAYVDGELAGISVVTKHLYTWPLISPEYFETKYPEHFAKQQIWYVGFVCVADKYQKTGTFQAMLESMTEHRKQGLFFMDFCKSNIDRKIILLCTRALSRLNPSVSMDREDVQEFWKVEWTDAK